MLLALPAAEKEKEKEKGKGKGKEKESSIVAKISSSQTNQLFSYIFCGINITKHLYF